MMPLAFRALAFRGSLPSGQFELHVTGPFTPAAIDAIIAILTVQAEILRDDAAPPPADGATMGEPVKRFIWIADRDLHPATNIWGRMWRTPDGRMSGTWLGGFPMGVNAATVEWRFEAAEEGGEE